MVAQIGSMNVALTLDSQGYVRALGQASQMTARTMGGISAQASRASGALAQLGQAGNFRNALSGVGQMDGAFVRLNSTIGAVGGSVIGLNGALAALSGGAAIQQIVALADQYTSLNNQLRSVLGTSGATADALDKVAEVAKRSRSSIQATGQLFTRISKARPTEGVDAVLRRVETIQKALVLGGATVNEAESVAIQLSQAFASGKLGGEELRAVLETPLGAELAKGLGVTIGKFREMAIAGKITTEVLEKSLDNVASDIDSKFGQSVATVGQAIQNLRNELLLFVGEADDVYGITQTLSSGINLLANNIGGLVSAAALLAPSFIIGRTAGNSFARLGEVAAENRNQINGLRTSIRETQSSLKQTSSQFDRMSAAIKAGGNELIQFASQGQQNRIANLSAQINKVGQSAEKSAKYQKALNAEIAKAQVSGLANAQMRMSNLSVTRLGYTDDLARMEGQMERLRRASTITGVALNGLKSAGAGLLAFLGGPWGVAFAVAAGAAIYFFDVIAKGRAEMEDAGRAIDEYRKRVDKLNDVEVSNPATEAAKDQERLLFLERQRLRLAEDMEKLGDMRINLGPSDPPDGWLDWLTTPYQKTLKPLVAIEKELNDETDSRITKLQKIDRKLREMGVSGKELASILGTASDILYNRDKIAEVEAGAPIAEPPPEIPAPPTFDQGMAGDDGKANEEIKRRAQEAVKTLLEAQERVAEADKKMQETVSSFFSAEVVGSSLSPTMQKFNAIKGEIASIMKEAGVTDRGFIKRISEERAKSLGLIEKVRDILSGNSGKKEIKSLLDVEEAKTEIAAVKAGFVQLNQAVSNLKVSPEQIADPNALSRVNGIVDDFRSNLTKLSTMPLNDQASYLDRVRQSLAASGMEKTFIDQFIVEMTNAMAIMANLQKKSNELQESLMEADPRGRLYQYAFNTRGAPLMPQEAPDTLNKPYLMRVPELTQGQSAESIISNAQQSYNNFTSAIGGWTERMENALVKVGLATEKIEGLNLGAADVLPAAQHLEALQAIHDATKKDLIPEIQNLADLTSVKLEAIAKALENLEVKVNVNVNQPAAQATPPGNYRGGMFRVGGAGGLDSQYVGFMASPNEVVGVFTPQMMREMQGGAANDQIIQNINIQTPDVNSFRQSRQQVQNEIASMVYNARR